MLGEEQRQRITDIAYECIADTMKLTSSINFKRELNGTLTYRVDFLGFKEKFSKLFKNALSAEGL